MRMAIVTNDVAELGHQYATTRLGYTALELGHEVWMVSVGDLRWEVDEHVRAHGWKAPKTSYPDGRAFLDDLRGPGGRREDLALDQMDVVLLRENPGKDADRPWAQGAGIMFGRLLVDRGVLVLNDPDGLSRASSKMYLQEFPESLRPPTVISRDREVLRRFAIDHGAPVVFKPLLGSGGKNVFLVRPDDLSNVNQIIEVIGREGFVIAQAYLPQAAEGDTRLVLMNGLPYKHEGRWCAFRRVRSGGDLRSNLSAGGELAQAEVTDQMLEVAELCRPRLIEDGIFLAGLDLVGDKIMEINVFSPGGMGSAQTFEKVNFTQGIIAAIERKVEHRKRYGAGVANRTLAVL